MAADSKVTKCPKCKSEILPEHQALNCHAHNDSNFWKQMDDVALGLELFEPVRRPKVIDEDKNG